MARASYATIPRSLLDNAKYLRLSFQASAALDRLHIACDSWGRFPADAVAIARRTGYLTLDWPEVFAELTHFVEVYEVDGEIYGRLIHFDDHLTARMKSNRGEPDFPGPVGNETVADHSPDDNRPLTVQSPATNRPVTGQQVADPCVRARPEPEPEPEPHTHRPPAHVAQPMPASDPAEPLPEHAEALVGQLVETLAARRQQYAPIGVRCDTEGIALAMSARVFGPALRCLAREYPDAWPHVAPLFCAGGPKEPALKKGYKPQDLALLRTILCDWTPDQVARPVNGNGYRERDRTPTWTKGPDMPDAPAHMRAIAE